MKEQKNIIGDLLKNTRLSKKISLDKASKATKISQTYLKALEEEDFDKIPGEVVLKGFMKIYAEFLGVDYSTINSELNKKLKKHKIPDEKKPQIISQQKGSVDFKKITLVLLSVLILLIVLVGLFSFIGYVIKASKKLSIVNSNKIVEKNIAKNIKIDAEIIEKTWLLVYSDGKLVFKGILSKGDKRSWVANKKLFLKIGNAGGVRLFSNGKEILSPGQHGQVISKEFVNE